MSKPSVSDSRQGEELEAGSGGQVEPTALANQKMRELFRGDAGVLLSEMRADLARLAADLGDGRLLTQVAARGHALRGSAALVELPTLSRAGALLTRAAEVAAEQASRNRARAESLVRSSFAALDPAARMVADGLDGQAENQQVLFDELLEAFEPGEREELVEAFLQEERAEADSPDYEERLAQCDETRPSQPVDGELAELVTLETGEGEEKVDPELSALLAETFGDELREILLAVPDLLVRLVDPAEQAEVCVELGRLFHTIKGSAALVGRHDLRDLGKSLEEMFEGPESDPGLIPLTPEFVELLEEPIASLFLAEGLEPPSEALALVLSAASASVVDQDDATREPGSAQDRESLLDDQAGLVADAEEDVASLMVEPEMMEAFAIDAQEALDASETALLRLERDPRDDAQLRLLFRHFHTLKGAAAAVGLRRIARQLHAGETLLEDVLEQRLQASPSSLVEMLLELVDSVAGLIAGARGSSHNHRILADVEARIAELVQSGEQTDEDADEKSGDAEPEADARGVWPGTGDAARTARQAEPESGPVAAQPEAAPAEGVGGAPAADAESAIVRVHASRLDLLMNRVSELIVSRTRFNDTIGVIGELKDKLNLSKLRLAETIEGFRGSFEFSASNPRGASEDTAGVDRSAALSDFTDLELDKYDDFNVLARTLVELAADAGEIVEQLGAMIDTLGEETRQFSKVTSSLQRAVTRMRLVSLDSLFRRLQRPVRDAARQSGKRVELSLGGADVQLDRGLVESLYGPLLHVVRNAVAHGIESAEERRASGKQQTGRIELTAEQRHGSVAIGVRDDGRGLNFNAIRTKGEKIGLLDPRTPATRDALAELIFRPGFSTHEKVTDIAGRGVGMDVVAREVAQLRGTLSVESEDGRGATFRIVLPITTVIDQVLLLRAGTQVFALSQTPIETVLNIDADQLEEGRQGPRLRLGEASLPVLALGTLVGAPLSTSTPTAVILRSDEYRVALLVDRVEAQREAVLRPLGPLFAGHPFLTSATFAGDGQVIFVLDPARIHALLSTQQGSTASLREALAMSASSASEAPAGEEAQVLWADDSISVRKLGEHFLSALGWTSRTAVDGRDALDKLRRGQFKLLVTDLEMPRMHGYELIYELRRDIRLRHMPVIVCSSRSSVKHRERAREAGANGYLTKPFSQAELAEVLQEYLGPSTTVQAEGQTSPAPATGSPGSPAPASPAQA